MARTCGDRSSCWRPSSEVAEIAAGIGLFARRFWGALLGIVFASLNLLGHMALLPTYPLLSTLVLAIDVVVLWALVVHGSQS
jgi:hypothetical protein